MKRRSGDLWLLPLAALLLLAPVAWMMFSDGASERRRDAALERVPEFPAPGQAPEHHAHVARDAVPAAVAHPPPPAAPRASDPMLSFVSAPAHSAAVIHVNAIFNTPLFERLQKCRPHDFGELGSLDRELGIDVTRDIDRVGMVPGGMAMTGFFEGKPLARTLLGQEAVESAYRGFQVYERAGRCAAQSGNTVVSGADCHALIDRALSPAPATDEVYGDVYLRTSQFAGADLPPEIRPIADALEGLTVRANVWDSISLSLEGAPRPGRDARQLAQMLKGAIAVARTQIDEDDVETRAVAELAQVSADSGKLELNLALPARDLFDRLQLPCEEADAGVR